MAAWFETHGFAVLLTMRVSDLILLSDLILRSGACAASRRMAASGLSWFETREDALLTMRSGTSTTPP
jgi:hypothetical protein